MNLLLTVWVVTFLLTGFWCLYRMAKVTAHRRRIKRRVLERFHEEIYEITATITSCDTFKGVDVVINMVIDFEAKYSRCSNRTIDKEMLHSYISKFNEKIDAKEREFMVHYCVI